jgi:hypothetical protein
VCYGQITLIHSKYRKTLGCAASPARGMRSPRGGWGGGSASQPEVCPKPGDEFWVEKATRKQNTFWVNICAWVCLRLQDGDRCEDDEEPRALAGETAEWGAHSTQGASTRDRLMFGGTGWRFR